MTTGSPGGFPLLTTFTTTFELLPDRTTLDIRPAGVAQPVVARMSKPGTVPQRLAYELFTGPGLADAAGQVTAGGALDVDGTSLGIVNLTGGRVPDHELHPLRGGPRSAVADNPARWRVVQPGLPVLTGRAEGKGTRLSYNRLTDALWKVGLEIPTPDYFVPLTFHYSAQGAQGFTVTLAPRRARFEVTVHDPRVDRRLTLAMVAALTQLLMSTPGNKVLDALGLGRDR